MSDDLEQIVSVYTILRYLLEKEVLSDDPSSVEMTRYGQPSIQPCRWGGQKLDISQIDWALKEKTWWFNGPIRQLKIEVPKARKIKLSQEDIDLLKRTAKGAKFSLPISFVKSQRSDQ